MKFIENIEKNRYIEFSNKHPKSHFLQSYGWGEFCRKAKGQIPKYIGMEDSKGRLVATALILLRKTPLGYGYGYCPRGFLIDYTNKKLIKEFTDYLKIYMKENKIIYIKFDPDLKYQDIDNEAKPIKNNNNNYDLYNYMLSLGYIHKGFNKIYEGNQPRYTFRIDLKKDFDEIEANFNKSFTKSIKKSYQYNLIIDNEIDVEDFYRLHQNNSTKDDFNPHTIEYYKIFSETMKDNVKYFNATFKPKEYLKYIDEELNKLNKESNKKKKADIDNQIKRLEKEKEAFKELDEDEIVVCSLICTYTANRAWSFFIGSDEIANITYAVSRSYYEAIRDAYDNGYEFFDLFGTVGDPNTTYKNLAKLHDFKRKFGDEYTEFIGEFDLVNNKLLYKMLPVLLKVYRKIRKSIS